MSATTRQRDDSGWATATAASPPSTPPAASNWPLRGAAANFPMALDEANHRLFIGCRKPAKLLVLDTTTGDTLASIDIVGDTDDLWYDAPARRLYITGGEGCITVIEQTNANT